MLTTLSDGSHSTNGDTVQSEAGLEVTSRAELPIDEVSGLGRRLVRGQVAHLAVPDAEATLVTFDVDARGAPLRISTHDLSSLFGDGPSEWEAVAGDGAEAQGYRAELALGDRVFGLPTGASTTLNAVRHWLLEPADAERLPDVSEVALDASGRLLLLSDQGRLLARIEGGLGTDQDTMRLEAIFTLPKDVSKPEGLVVASDAPLVAIDQKGKGAALFALDRLP